MWKKIMMKKCEMTRLINEESPPSKNQANVSSKDGKNDIENEIHVHHYMCGICQKLFAICNSFAVHLETHTGDTDQCNICSKKCDSKKDYFKHLLSHAKKSPQTCLICNKTYITWLKLRCHLDWHDKTFLCHLCDTKFVDKEHLDKHSRLHTADEFHACKICNKLESHNSCVQKVLPPKQFYKCDTCGKVFGKKSSLSAHRRRHKFPCKFCPKEFILRADLFSHMRWNHPETLFQPDFTSHLNGSHSEFSIDSASHSKGSNLEDKIDLTSHFSNSYTVPSDESDFTTDLKVVTHRLPVKEARYKPMKRRSKQT